MSQLGMGVMIQMLGGNRETVEALQASLGKTIEGLKIDPKRGDGGALVLGFGDGSELALFDSGQSCCEARNMSCDDNLNAFVGATFDGAELREGTPPVESEYAEEHEILFLDVKTSKGILQLVNHNEHNGYYGGFAISAEYTPPQEAGYTPSREKE